MKWIRPSKIKGRIPAPPSKSDMIRATAAASLAAGVSKIIRPSLCDDTLAGLGVAAALGARVAFRGRTVEIQGGGRPVKKVLDCGESGLCLRLFAPIAALGKQEMILSGHGTLLARPVGMAEIPLTRLGVVCESDGGFPPLRVKGPLRGGRVELDGSVSSQLLSGLLMALPVCERDSKIEIKNLVSRPYVDLTVAVLSRFGVSVSWDKTRDTIEIAGRQRYEPQRFEVEGDWSGASFLLVAAALAGRIAVENLSAESCQADVRILDALRAAGARVSLQDRVVLVETDELKAFEFDAADCPDLFPPLAALALFCDGWSEIRGVERLRHKESDRAAALAREFARIGGRMEIEGNVMKIGGGALRGGGVDPRGDHRMAMAGAVAGLRAANGVRIEHPQVVSKSYPRFFEDLASVGGDIT